MIVETGTAFYSPEPCSNYVERTEAGRFTVAVGCELFCRELTNSVMRSAALCRGLRIGAQTK